MKRLFFTVVVLSISIGAQSHATINNWIYNGTTNQAGTTAQAVLKEDQLSAALHISPLLEPDARSNIVVAFPTPEGKSKDFRMFYSPVMPTSLTQEYPDIKTYTGIGLDNPSERVSVTTSNSGIKAMIMSSKGNVFIDQTKEVAGTYRVSYHESEKPITDHCLGCGGGDAIIVEPPPGTNLSRNDFPSCVGEDQPCYTIGDTLVTFRFAGILTAEANNEFADGTVAGGLAWMNALVNQINLLWVRELSFRLELIENSDSLIYTNETQTPWLFTEYDMYVELPRVLDHLTDVIGPGGYDTPASSLMWEYGAVFNVGYGGGLAYVPGSTSANLPYYTIFNHEIGHNLGSSHNCSIENGWSSTIGGSIMCWRGNTLPGSGGDQYTSHTIDIAIKYQQEMFWSSGYDYQRGWTRVATGNTPPEVGVPTGGFTIPKETPFVLEGYATDVFVDIPTLSWEQNDASDSTFESPNFPEFTGPLFCSVDGTLEGNKRYFPHMPSLLANQYDTPLSAGNDYLVEKLPFAEREINMRLLARDNNPIAGGFSYANVQFFVAGDAGPFRVTSQPEEVTWEVGTTETVNWDVANTADPAGVNSAQVDIYLSIDGGDNFDIMLAEATANDGTHDIIVPIVPTRTTCRLMVKSADNIFFDINDSFFTIHNSAVPQATVDATTITLNLPPDTALVIEREISNSGAAGSVLVYDLAVESYLNGAGYLSFDGNDDYVDLGTNLLSGSGDFSISLWVQTTGIDQVIIQQRNGGFNGEHQLRVNESGRPEFWTYSDGWQWAATATETINDGNWHHIVVVQDGTINGGRLYVDGSESASNSGGLVNLNGGFHSYLGADMRDYVEYFSGNIDDVGVFSGALTASSISTLFLAGPGFNLSYDHDDYSAAQHLVAFYPMNSMSGTTLVDASGNDHDGIIQGPDWAGDLVPEPQWLMVSSESSWLESGATEELDIIVITTGLTTDAVYNAEVLVLTAAEVVAIPVYLSVNENLGIVDHRLINSYELSSAFPNPFNPLTTIQYSIPTAENVRLSIYNVLGEEIEVLAAGLHQQGSHIVRWNAARFSSGMYFYRLHAGEFSAVHKLLLLK